MKKRFWDRQFEVIDLRAQSYKPPVFEPNEAIAFVRYAVEHGTRVLGGDVVEQRGKEFVVTGEYWYNCSPNPIDTLNCALYYLQEYQRRESVSKLYVGIVTDNLDDLLSKA